MIAIRKFTIIFAARIFNSKLMKTKIIFILCCISIVLCFSCSANGNNKKEENAEVSDSSLTDSAYTAEDSVSQQAKRYKPTEEEMKAMQREETRDEAREEYYSTDGDQADNPDFDDDIPGDEHDEEFIDNDGDPELYNE